MVNAQEHDLLPSVLWDWRTDLDQEDKLALLPVLAAALVVLVGDGLIEVRRMFVDGSGGYEVVPPGQLPEVLADQAAWEYTGHSWIHRDEGLAIVETQAGRELSQTARSGVPDPQSSNPYLK
ncbi:hypothetical protein GAR06_04594 [Micromonospora saelicesensis]|uniref:hypothetical protein n=1 Tax=Micromonospora saelicesensis TaxID=285676 RepID=UPI000DC35900|nr:hypothetical protein [Micromonospora saelicesensis]RAO43461.1 hypothetical protein GAR06_04594 [Micromonospora saelicesensis]